MPKCTINGQEVEVKAGATIMDAFYQLGMKEKIAHYCYHPSLSIAGVCRLCMVEIEGNPRLQIACNTVVTEGMKVDNNSAKVNEAVKWGMDFHLINHPLDCPICDQAGECGLQDQYMAYGKYEPEMAERKVKKRKVVDLGPRVVLDSERCVLCSRCVRFTEEVTKTNELGIFNRGDRSEIGTFEDRPLDNHYSVNTVDICPVGALTSKDFRFRQRVWLLKNAESICTGCSTGCNVNVFFNKEGVFRLKPLYNEKVNGYWMCDTGRDTYKPINRDARLLDARLSFGGDKAQAKVEYMIPLMGAKKAAEWVREAKAANNAKSVALVLTGQYSSEEYESIVSTFKADVGTDQIFHWVNNPESFESFDGLLFRGDRNPNTKGLLQTLQKHGVMDNTWKDLVAGLESGTIQTLVVAGPLDFSVFPDLQEKLALFAKAKRLVWLSSGKSELVDASSITTVQIPMRTHVEKHGTYVNHSGIAQSVKPALSVVAKAMTLSEVADVIAGRNVKREEASSPIGKRAQNEFTTQRGAL
ncbi:MAG: 2Fe-2S iron-sulfur cluster-binding protein [Bdellovibrionaceae bacterium]|nr:2Fe-2S iron-sulfur cluster-binding protein [Pseudobdellovibrionaceae bacterium]